MTQKPDLNSEPKFEIKAYSEKAISHLQKALQQNTDVLRKVSDYLMQNVLNGGSLFVFGSGHSALLPLELYHRAGGPSFVIPLIADFLLPHAGPPVVRLMERLPETATVLLNRGEPRPGEMIWIVSQSGINSASVEMALEAKKRKMRTVAFTSLIHSRAVNSRHPSHRKLFEICDEVIDLGGEVGDAAIEMAPAVFTGPLSTLTGIFLAHSILVGVNRELEKQGFRCVYTSVNTPEGEARNRELEKRAMIRDPRLR